MTGAPTTTPHRATSHAAGAYVVGRSLLHRAPAGPKLAALMLCSLALLLVRSPAGVGTATLVVTGLYALAGLGPRAAWGQVRPLRMFLPVVFALQWWLMDLTSAAVLSTRLVVLVALAGLVTCTTRVSDLLAAIERGLSPLARVGVDVERIALVLALALRSVPVIADLAGRVRDAQRARGRERDVRAFAVPLVVGSMRQADALGEALRARGFDD
ncbi:energy-coupling factor transporter transmembrane protein EcfT [Oerskovia sp. Sa1BUA8]|uniref:Energy-coupling factor transporter transmembrane protein EcfT n=1 Tax=Oerskovia douganii TaxID=2762210 RepID=A0A9D5UA99_9CELL|nr:energy-coupling factor transporter transmembrane component T [Oerskovia douganii]MBE7701404.1 energy-coupling factor transporter transmembrane protein EcfT [Oerskovia douganii]